MHYLYVCHFSNGHIKVGRSIHPKSRIAGHADRVACVGIELSEYHIAECVGHAAPAEDALIKRCAAVAAKRYKNEWFEGLDYLDVCEWANELSKVEYEFKLKDVRPKTTWQFIIEKICERHRMNQVQIAEAIGSTQSTINGIARGCTKDPGYSLGKALIDLSNNPSPTSPAQQIQAA